MKKMIAKLKVMMLMLPFVVVGSSCSCSGDNEALPLSPEQMRLMAATSLDTATIREVLNLDSLEQVEQLDQLSAEAWILVEDSLGLLISSKNANERLFPASLTKMMTCMLTLEHGNMGDTIEITKDVFRVGDCRVRLGDRFTEENLLHEMMMQSDNDAAYALAKQVGGDTVAFVAMMNEKAAYLSMDSTHFANPNGMPNDSNYTTARDLLTLARYCMRDSTFAQIVGSKMIDVDFIDGRHMPCENTNVLLNKYEGCFGVKTGYTRQAGACLASAATRNGETLYLIMLKSRSRSSRFSESATLLDYGFRVMEAYRSLNPSLPKNGTRQ